MNTERKLKTKAFNDSLNEQPTTRAKYRLNKLSRKAIKARIPLIILDRLKYFTTSNIVK